MYTERSRRRATITNQRRRARVLNISIRPICDINATRNHNSTQIIVEMNGNESVMKRKPQTEELEDGEREKRRKRVEGMSPAPIEFPMNQSMEIAVPENPLAPLLDRSGGLAKYAK